MNDLIDPASIPALQAFTSAVRRARLEREEHEKKGCSYPNCSNYKPTKIPGTARYCCTGCHMDHEDWKEMKGIIDPCVIAEPFVLLAEEWETKAQRKIFSAGYCTEKAFAALLLGAYHSTDYDPRDRYAVEQGNLDRLWYVVDTTAMSRYWSETKFLNIARCHKKTQADKIVAALNAHQPTKTRRKNG